MAGIAAATINNTLGIAGIGNVGIYGAKALDANGNGFHSDIASAIRWCTQRPVPQTVINLSLGGPTSSTVLADALSFAYNTQNRLLAAAAGNSSCTDCIEYPARSSLVIAVTCTTQAQTFCVGTSRGPEAELSAPGTNIESTYNRHDADYVSATGTSMSTPHVAGALALKWSWSTGFSHTDLRVRAQDSAFPLGAAGRDDFYGYGRVDAKCIMHNGPYPPESLSVAPGDAIGEIDISWLGPSWNCGDFVNGYTINRATSETGTYTQVASLGAAARSWTDTGRTAALTYWYQVRAINNFGTGVPATGCSKPYPSLPGVC